MHWSKRKLKILIAVLSTILVILSSAAGVMAKYTTDKTLQGQLSISVDIGTISLKEHLAERNADGSYRLEDDVVEGNTYVLLPGVDIPKDPFVTIEKTSSLPVYVFVEIVDATPNSAVTWSVTADWQEIVGLAGKNGGKVYVYKSEITTFSGNIQILQDNTVYVSQDLLINSYSGQTIALYANMYQAAAGDTAEAVYRSYNP